MTLYILDISLRRRAVSAFSLEIKLSYMDEFEALTSTCERLRKEVA